MPEIHMRGVRGATTADANTREAILAATRELLSLMIDANRIQPEDVASAIFTTTIDLTADYPALAARALGWHEVALMCMHEMDVPHGLKQCIRILLHWNTSVAACDIKHVYLKGAVSLRPDRAVSLSHQTQAQEELGGGDGHCDAAGCQRQTDRGDCSAG